MVPDTLLRYWQSLPPRVARAIGHLGSLFTGLLLALILHYLLYRIGLPGTPFIYVVF